MGKRFGTIFSDNRLHRYTLHRALVGERGTLVFVCLNPSTADEVDNDPTVRRCIRYGNDWGYSDLYVMNIFAYRSTDPKKLYRSKDPVGRENDYWLKRICGGADLVIAAWGTHGAYDLRGEKVLALLARYGGVHCMGVTKAGHPKHPLYLRADLRPAPYPADRLQRAVQAHKATECTYLAALRPDPLPAARKRSDASTGDAL